MALTPGDRQTVEDAIEGIEWLMDKVDTSAFECNCDPSYESDTNAWNHTDSCASWREDGLDAIIGDLRRIASD